MSDEQIPDEVPVKKKKTVSEELEIAGGQLIGKIQDIVKQGNVRRLIIRNSEGRVLLDTTLTVGAVAGGLLSLAAWPLAVLTGVAAMVSRVRVEIIREINDDDEIIESKQKIEIDVQDDE
jgi:hypothetical protein